MALPTLFEFQEIVDDYYEGLTEKRRDKALMTSDTFIDIINVILYPRDTTRRDAQFRYWAKTNFALEHEIFPIPTPAKKEDFTLYRKDKKSGYKKVTLTENIYEAIVKAHCETTHGGRDKTVKYIKQEGLGNIPKKLVDAFIKKCPLCKSTKHNKKKFAVAIKDSNKDELMTSRATPPPPQVPKPQQLSQEQMQMQMQNTMPPMPQFCQIQQYQTLPMPFFQQPPILPSFQQQYLNEPISSSVPFPTYQQFYQPPPLNCIAPQQLLAPVQNAPY